jgi:hypothetical protein
MCTSLRAKRRCVQSAYTSSPCRRQFGSWTLARTYTYAHIFARTHLPTHAHTYPAYLSTLNLIPLPFTHTRTHRISRNLSPRTCSLIHSHFNDIKLTLKQLTIMLLNSRERRGPYRQSETGAALVRVQLQAGRRVRTCPSSGWAACSSVVTECMVSGCLQPSGWAACSSVE